MSTHEPFATGPLAPGASVGPGYEVIEHLRRGRALDVYDVWSEARACRCIAKSLRPDRAGTEGPRTRLLNEGRLLCRLTHPHIVRGYEILAGPAPVVIMETLTGDTLGHLIARSGALSVSELAHLGLHLASAVRYLHRQGYLHLDLKPSNVIAECGKARLIDLSVARPAGQAHAGIGTWCYMAPEQARGGRLGPAADVWGIGVVLFEATTGQPAFDDPQGQEYEWCSGTDSAGTSDESDDYPDDYPQLVRDAPPIKELRSVPPEFGAAVAACLDHEEARRPSLEQLMAILEPLAELPASEHRFAPAHASSITP